MSFTGSLLPNSAVIGTLAAVCGSALGAAVPLLSNVVLQRGLTKRELLNHQLQGLETLYSDFILEASRLLSHSMFNNLPDPEKVVGVYTLAARIRLNSSVPVIDAAESVVTQIITQYGEPNLNVEDMRKSVLESRVDWIGEFTSACRKELSEVFKRGGALA